MSKIRNDLLPGDNDREMLIQMESELDKAVYWYNKKIGDKKEKSQIIGACTLCNKDKRNYHTEIVEYVPSKDCTYKWMVYNVAYYNDGNSPTWMPVHHTAWETEGSVGAVVMITFGEVNYALIMTTHFFLRYCDDQRNLGKMNGLQTIVDLFVDNKSIYINKDFTYEDEQGNKCLDVKIGDALAKGYLQPDLPSGRVVVELRTILTDDMLTPAQLKHTFEFRDKADSVAQEIYEKTKTLMYKRIGAVVDQTIETEGYDIIGTYVRKKIGNNASLLYITMSVCLSADLIYLILSLHNPISNCKKLSLKSVPIDIKHLYNACMEIVWSYNKNEPLDYAYDVVKEQVLNLIDDCNIDVDTDKVVDYMEKIKDGINSPDNNIRKYIQTINFQKPKQETMNTVQKSEIKKVLKEYKLGSFFNDKIEQITRKKFENYLDCVEPLYAISRMVPYIDNDKIRSAERKWVEIVIRNSWQNELLPYTAKYGVEMVVKAASYLMEIGEWESPKGKVSLNTRAQVVFAGLKAIDETVEYLRDLEPETKVEQEVVDDVAEQETQEQVEVIVEQATESNDSQVDDGVLFNFTPNADNEDAILHMVEHLDSIKDFLMTNASNIDQNMQMANSAKQIDELKQQVADMTVQLANSRQAYDALKQDVQKIKDERDATQRKLNERNEEYANQKRLLEAREADISNLRGDMTELDKDYKQMKTEFEQFKAAAKSELPVKKVYPLSKITCRAYMGAGSKTLTYVLELLKDCNVYVDMNK